MLGVKIGDKHTCNDWGLLWGGVTIGFPSPKTYYVDVPGSNGQLDLSEVLTDEVRYNNRVITFTFTVINRFESWHSKVSKIASYLHGKKFKIILDTDLYYYYYGRVTLNTEKSNVAYGKIVLECNVDPYKLENQESGDYWLWDNFSFEDGVIREYRDLVVNGTLDLDILDIRMAVVPRFVCSAPMELIVGQLSYTLLAGENTLLDFKLKTGDTNITFSGNGTVSIWFRGGSL